MMNRLRNWRDLTPQTYQRWYGDDEQGIVVEYPASQMVGMYDHYGDGVCVFSARVTLWRAWWLARQEGGEWGYWGLSDRPFSIVPLGWVRFLRNISEPSEEEALNVLFSIGASRICVFERDVPEEWEE